MDLNEKKEKHFENFDFVKRKSPEQENYKKIPRDRASRKRYPGYTCPCCKDYYQCLHLDEKKLTLRLKKVSRHRGKPPPKTPENYWELGFPDYEECVKRGYTEPAKPYSFRERHRDAEDHLPKRRKIDCVERKPHSFRKRHRDAEDHLPKRRKITEN